MDLRHLRHSDGSPKHLWNYFIFSKFTEEKDLEILTLWMSRAYIYILQWSSPWPQMFFTNNHGRIYTSVGYSYYEYLVAAYVKLGRIYTPLAVDAKTAWHSKGSLHFKIWNLIQSLWIKLKKYMRFHFLSFHKKVIIYGIIEVYVLVRSLLLCFFNNSCVCKSSAILNRVRSLINEIIKSLVRDDVTSNKK